MFEEVLPFLCCPRCGRAPLQHQDPALSCLSCGAAYPIQEGIPDLIGSDSEDVITPFQRVMQTSWVVSIYESIWRRAGYFLASSRSFDDEIKTVLKHQRRASASTVLDLACGPGVFTRPLARRTEGTVVGLDLSWPMLRHARRRISREGLKNIVLIRGSAFRLPFRPATFTYINCCGALHLFERPGEALQEMARVLRPKGYLCVQTTIRPNRSAGLASFLERFIRFGFFEEAGLRGMMSSNGFNILESERHRISFTLLAQNDD